MSIQFSKALLYYFQKAILLALICFTLGENAHAQTAKADNIDTSFAHPDVMPVFKSDLADFLRAYLNYPEEAREKHIAGRVILTFIITEDGLVKDITVSESSGNKALDDEAVWVMSYGIKLHLWKPGMKDNKPIPVKIPMPISFDLVFD